MRNLISFLGVILFTSTLLTSFSGEGNQIYGKWFLQGKDNIIDFTEEGKVFVKEKEKQNFEFVGYFDFNEEIISSAESISYLSTRRKNKPVLLLLRCGPEQAQKNKHKG